MTDWGVPGFNDWVATCDLIDAAEDWERISDDPRIPLHLRLEAEGFARAIWQEMCWKGDGR